MPASRPKVRAAWPEVEVPTHHVPSGLEGVPDGGHDRGLARPGHPDDQFDAPARGGDPFDRVHLPVGQVDTAQGATCAKGPPRAWRWRASAASATSFVTDAASVALMPRATACSTERSAASTVAVE